MEKLEPSYTDDGKLVWQFLRRLSIELPYEPAAPLLGIYSKALKTCTMWKCASYKNVHKTKMFTALFIIAKKWKQRKCPSADERVNKMCCIHTIEYCFTEKETTLWRLWDLICQLSPSSHNAYSKMQTPWLHRFSSVQFNCSATQVTGSRRQTALQGTVSWCFSHTHTKVKVNHFQRKKFLCANFLSKLQTMH